MPKTLQLSDLFEIDDPHEFRDFLWGHDSTDYEKYRNDVSLIEEFGGEGRGDKWWMVFTYKGDFYRMGGFYSSWEGFYMNELDFERVEPKEITKTIYVPVNDN